MFLKSAHAFPGTRVCCCLALLFGTSAATRAADPTNSQQYWLELINRMRLNPAAELEHLTNYSIPGSAFGSPSSDDTNVAAALQFYGTSASALASQWSTLVAAPALAWNGVLSSSSATYSNVMVSMDQQEHDLDGLDLNTRVENAGYGTNYLDLGETLFATSQSPFHGHAAFAIDWGDDDNNTGNGFGTGIQNPAYHRIFMMDPIFKEVGIGYQTASLAGKVNVTGPIVVTQHFGNHYRFTGSAFVADAFLTGSVYEESVVVDNFYTPGEGLGGRTVFIYNNATNALLKTGTTNSAGGYNILLDGLVNGVTYRVEVPSTGLGGQTFTLNQRVEIYQDELGNDVPVTFYDNAYARFQVVPEPGGVILIASGALMGLTRRHRRQNVAL
jgi:uncharacterized protein YkwD